MNIPGVPMGPQVVQIPNVGNIPIHSPIQTSQQHFHPQLVQHGHLPIQIPGQQQFNPMGIHQQYQNMPMQQQQYIPPPQQQQLQQQQQQQQQNNTSTPSDNNTTENGNPNTNENE